ncbi:recombinase family protein [Nocardia sp. CA-135953]|uniref:recombinase family protein n=1 Tax=Nocardia sp. CA-135953 TaxID=3239978 RepID=UPI003D957F94
MNETHHPPANRDRAVLFLSVASSAGTPSDQGEPLGIALQRQAERRVADDFGLEISREFVEIGAPATRLSERPVLRRLLDYLAEHSEIRFTIFPGVHRFARDITHAQDLRERFHRLHVGVLLLPTGEQFEPMTETASRLAAAFGGTRR